MVGSKDIAHSSVNQGNALKQFQCFRNALSLSVIFTKESFQKNIVNTKQSKDFGIVTLFCFQILAEMKEFRDRI